MPLLPTTLSDALTNMTPTGEESEAITAFANAYVSFMSEATAGGVPIIPAALEVPKAACILGMTGLSTDGKAAIQNGVTQFWTTMALPAVTVALWPLATAITPPTTLSSISVGLEGVFATNTTAGLSLEAACETIALVLYTASIGGSAVLSVPIPGTIVPIL